MLSLTVWLALAVILGSRMHAVSAGDTWGDYDDFARASCWPTAHLSAAGLHHYMAYVLETENLNSTWLPITRRDLGGWYWLSGEYQGEALSISTKVHYGRDCGVLRAGDKLLDDIECDRQYPKYLCQKEAMESPCKGSTYTCFVYNGTQYTIVEKNSNWYEARAGCYGMGQELAVLPKSSQPDLLEILHEKIPTFHDTWVGLRKKDYFIHHRNTSINVFYWNKDEPCPCQSKHSCVTINKLHGSSIIWKPENCSGGIQYQSCPFSTESSIVNIVPDVHVSHRQLITTEVPSYPGKEKMVSNFRTAFGIVLVLFILLCLLLLAFCVIGLKYREDIATFVRKRARKQAKEAMQLLPTLKQDLDDERSHSTLLQTQLESTENKLKDSLNLIEKNNDAHATEMNLLREQIEALNKSSQESKQRTSDQINKLMKDLSTASAKLKDNDHTINALRQEADEQNKLKGQRKSELEQQVKELERKLKVESSSAAHHFQELNMCKQQLKDVTQEKELMEKKINEAPQKSVEQLQTDTVLMSELSQTKENLVKTTEQLANSKKIIERLHQHLDNAQKGEPAKTGDQLARANATINNLCQQLKEKENNVFTLEEKVKKMTQEKEKEHEQRSQVDESKKKLQTSFHGAIAKKNQLEEQLRKANAKAENLLEQCERSNAQFSGKERELRSLQTNYNQLEKEKRQLAKQVKEQEQLLFQAQLSKQESFASIQRIDQLQKQVDCSKELLHITTDDEANGITLPYRIRVMIDSQKETDEKLNSFSKQIEKLEKTLQSKDKELARMAQKGAEYQIGNKIDQPVYRLDITKM